jgi:hypothetical protein
MSTEYPEHVKEAWERIQAQREEILEAFIAKYGIEPDQAVQVIKRKGNKLVWGVRHKLSQGG